MDNRWWDTAGGRDIERVHEAAADQDQATPPSAAVTEAPERSPKARKARGTNGQTKLLQKGMSR